MPITMATITQYAPIVYQLPYNDPTYLPSNLGSLAQVQPYWPGDADAYLANSSVWVNPGNGRAAGPAAGFDIVDPNGHATGDGSYVYINGDPTATSPIRAGDSTLSAPAYVHLVSTPGDTSLIDIQYWLFYPVRGRSTLLLSGFGGALSMDMLPPTVGGTITGGYQGGGEHQGDWKHVTARVNATSGELQGVFYSQHGGGIWVTADDEFQFNGQSILQPDGSGATRVVAYAARNTHSCYPAPGKYIQPGTGGERLGFGFGLMEWVAQGPAWDTAPALQVVADDAGVPSIPITTKQWLTFAGWWGPDLNEQIDKATWAFLANGLPSWMQGETFNDLQDWLASQATQWITNANAASPAHQTSWPGDAGGPLSVQIVSAWWGASLDVNSNYQRVIDVTALARLHYANGLRTFAADVETWSPGETDPDSGDQKRLVLTYSLGSQDGLYGGYASENGTQSFELP